MKINKLNTKFAYYCVTGTIFLLIFVLCGEKGYLLWKDSMTYLSGSNTVGVMPLYPLFLKVNKLIFGENIYLYAVVLEQTVFTIACLFSFIEFVSKRFSLSYLTTYPVVIFAVFMPFTVNLPLSVSNHDILTEAIAYPLFYVFMICFLEAVWKQSYSRVFMTFVVSCCLAWIRTQMQLCFVLVAVAFFYVAWMRGRRFNWKKQTLCVLFSIVMCLVIVCAGIFVTFAGNKVGQGILVSIGSAETKEMEINVDNTDSENITNQYSHLLIDKGLYEIEEDDYLLFEDEELQKLCREIYNVSEVAKHRYVYARDDLWVWEDIMNGILGGARIAAEGWSVYAEANPDTYLDSSAVNTIAIALIIEHFGRVILHIVQMMPQGFICTVFFQKEKIYALCHWITFFIYVSSLAMVIWGYRKKEISRIYSEFLLSCIVINVLFVVILCVMFFAMQRYLVYCFGIFYVAYYLMAKEIFKYYWKKFKKDV